MGDLTRTRLTDWDVTWGTNTLGFVDKVTPNLSLHTKPIKVGSLGDIEMGNRIIGLTGDVKVEVREIDAVTWQQLMPWYTSGASANLVPTLPQDLYGYAKALVLHPHDKAASDHSEDITLSKAVPTVHPVADRDGVNDDKIVISFKFYPNRASLPTIDFGTIGG